MHAAIRTRLTGREIIARIRNHTFEADPFPIWKPFTRIQWPYLPGEGERWVGILEQDTFLIRMSLLGVEPNERSQSFGIFPAIEGMVRIHGKIEKRFELTEVDICAEPLPYGLRWLMIYGVLFGGIGLFAAIMGESAVQKLLGAGIVGAAVGIAMYLMHRFRQTAERETKYIADLLSGDLVI